MTDARTAALEDADTTARVRRYAGAGPGRKSAPGETFARRGLKPTPPQLYAIARATLELLGLEYPADRADASLLIGRLREQLAADAGAGSSCGTPDGIPF